MLPELSAISGAWLGLQSCLQTGIARGLQCNRECRDDCLLQCCEGTDSPTQHCVTLGVFAAQDTERAVRKCAVDQLPLLARSLGSEAACSAVLPKVFEMTEDEDVSVCCNAVTALGPMLRFLTPGETPSLQGTLNCLTALAILG